MNPREMMEKGRWKQLKADYGLLNAIKPFLFGEKVDDKKLIVPEPQLPRHIIELIYTISLAALLVTGSVEIVSLLESIQHRDWVQFGIALLMIYVLLKIVYSMDKTFARTLPRIGIFASRHQYVELVMSIGYCASVGAIEISTLTILIMNENHIGDILKGRPLLAESSAIFTIMAVARAVIAFWNIIQARLVNDPLQPTLETAKNEGAALLGGQLMDQIRKLKDINISMGSIMDNFLLFLKTTPRAPRNGPDTVTANTNGTTTRVKYDRDARQIELDKQHARELVQALDEIQSGHNASLLRTLGTDRASANSSNENLPDNSAKLGSSSHEEKDQVLTGSKGVRIVPENTDATVHDSDTFTADVLTSQGDMRHLPDTVEVQIPVSTDDAATSQFTVNLENTYALPEDLQLSSYIAQNRIKPIFGIDENTFRRAHEKSSYKVKIESRKRGVQTQWKVQDILFLVEQGVLESTEEIGAMVVKSPLIVTI